MKPKSLLIEEYFSWQTEANQEKLQSIRQVILEVASEAKEVDQLSYACIQDLEVLVYYAAAKKHIRDFTQHSEAIIAVKKEFVTL